MLLVISWHPTPSSNLSTYSPSFSFHLTPSPYLLQLQPTITATIHLPSPFSFSILASILSYPLYDFLMHVVLWLGALYSLEILSCPSFQHFPSIHHNPSYLPSYPAISSCSSSYPWSQNLSSSLECILPKSISFTISSSWAFIRYLLILSFHSLSPHSEISSRYPIILSFCLLVTILVR